MTLDVAPAVRAIVAPAWLAVDGVTVLEREPRLDVPFAEAESKLRALGLHAAPGVRPAPPNSSRMLEGPTASALSARSSDERQRTDLDAALQRTRALYRAVGLDPTKTRPSSEALLRRVRRGETLPRVNTIVDICNWCSVETQIAFGVYDRDRLAGDTVTLRLGTEGEGYDGIRKDRVNVAGRLTLSDAQGPFGNPTSDSLRTSVSPATTRVLFVLFIPAATPAADARRALDLTAERVAVHAGGTEIARLLYSATGS